jgi:hypothetical protein
MEKVSPFAVLLIAAGLITLGQFVPASPVRQCKPTEYTIIETKEKDCVSISIPESKTGDGIPDQKIYCVGKGEYSALP